MKNKRIVLNSVGSLGDLHPYIALGRALMRNGFTVRFATANLYRDRVLADGFEFAPVGPHLDKDDIALAERVMDTQKGTDFIFNEIVFPNFERAYDDLSAACEGVDALVSGSLSYASPLVTEKLHLPWISTILAPVSLFSVDDFPIFANFPKVARWFHRNPFFGQLMLNLTRAMTSSWAKPAYALRAKLGLSKGPNPVMEGVFSPTLALGLFSSTFAPPQRDWPKAFKATGFIYHDQREDVTSLPKNVADFLDEGRAPLIFTLGSSAHLVPGGFYKTGYEIAKALGERAILVTGKTTPQFPVSDAICETEYLPFSEAFPRAKLVVHHGGIGTTAQALRAGVPMLGVPMAHDQHDNFDHAKRLGTAEYFDDRNEFTFARASERISAMLANPSYQENATKVSRKLAAENGVETAVREIAKVL